MCYCIASVLIVATIFFLFFSAFCKKFFLDESIVRPVLYTPETKTVGGPGGTKGPSDMYIDLKSLSYEVGPIIFCVRIVN